MAAAGPTQESIALEAFDAASFADYADNMPARKTKVVCTIGPTSCDREALFRLADEGMSVVRLNMSHGDHASHKAVVDLVREYNSLGRSNLAIMMDTKGPEVRSGDLAAPLPLDAGDKITFTITEGADGTDGRISVNYDEFVEDASVGDMLLVDGGIMSMQIDRITDNDVLCSVVDGGTLSSRRHLNIRGKSANLPAITDRDWADIKFGVEIGVDYYALSFVRDAAVIYELKEFLTKQGLTGTSQIGVLAKIESADSVEHLEEILDAVDGAMVARGDLGAELPVEEVPYWQSKIVQGCRRRGKPVIVATNMLESMIKNPTPTRAEVSDIAIAVREGTDAVMLSGETAHGSFPHKALETMATVARRTELSMLKYHGTRRYGSDEAPPIEWIVPPRRRVSSVKDQGLSEMFAYHATTMANTLKSPLVVFTRKGNMPALLSHYRPDFPIFCFTENELVQRRLALYHGVVAMYMRFNEQQETTFDRAVDMLKERGLVKGGQLLAVVQSGRQPIWRAASTHIIQVRAVPEDAAEDSDTDESEGEARGRPAKA
ncbi:plastidial pyruvate kinase 2-like [Micractinium conductrix]|uniref:Pyruvate kinase n=1 Tax=Micractinium conductrix TaxID=554055 RepID=A0A2P6VEQ8_9CHLO|nr:plastidial pyruvate kinase 2-like [Micractinium conductrix]|eukprot:PSC72575.1 plastidial pyruvate kinase 2-like [Micractinium conductrix]